MQSQSFTSVTITTDLIRQALKDYIMNPRESFMSLYPTPLAEFIRDNYLNARMHGIDSYVSVDLADYEFYMATNAAIQAGIDARDQTSLQDNDIVYFVRDGVLYRKAYCMEHRSADETTMTLTATRGWAYVNRDKSVTFDHSGTHYYPKRAALKSLGQCQTTVQYFDRHGARASGALYANVRVNAWLHPSADVDALCLEAMQAIREHKEIDFSEKPTAVETFLAAKEIIDQLDDRCRLNHELSQRKIDLDLLADLARAYLTQLEA